MDARLKQTLIKLTEDWDAFKESLTRNTCSDCWYGLNKKDAPCGDCRLNPKYLDYFIPKPNPIK